MRSLFSVAVATLFALLSLPAHAQEGAITIISPVPFAESSGATSNVKADCTLETRLPKFIEDYSKKGVDVVIGDDPGEESAGKVLHLEFTNVHGPGGGAWSGPKIVTVEGTLTENGEVIGSFIGTRYSTGPVRQSRYRYSQGHRRMAQEPDHGRVAWRRIGGVGTSTRAPGL